MGLTDPTYSTLSRWKPYILWQLPCSNPPSSIFTTGFQSAQQTSNKEFRHRSPSSPAASPITLLAFRAKTCISGQCLPAVRQLTLKQVVEKPPNSTKYSQLVGAYWLLNGQLGKRNQGFTGPCRLKWAQNSRNSFSGWFSWRLGNTNLYP